MRTEQQLLDALEHVSQQVPAAEPVLQRILSRTSPTSVRRRRAIILLAAAFVVILAIVLPNVFVDRTAVPADTRRPGNWNSIYRLDLEPGWRVNLREVSAESERTALVAPMVANDYAGGCEITVNAVGGPRPDVPPERRTAVDVNGRPGFQTRPGADEVLVPLYWQYQENAWAEVLCDISDAQNLDIARRMVFEPTPLRVPYRLRSLPDRYDVSETTEGLSEETGQLASGVSFVSDDPALPGMNIDVYPGSAPEANPDTAGNWGGTVNDMPAVFDAEGPNLSLTSQGYQILVEVTGDLPGVPRSLRAQKYRELAIDLANRVEVVPDMSSPDSWPDANQALKP